MASEQTRIVKTCLNFDIMALVLMLHFQSLTSCTFFSFSILKTWLINTLLSCEMNANNTTSKSSCRAHVGGHFELQKLWSASEWDDMSKQASSTLIRSILTPLYFSPPPPYHHHHHHHQCKRHHKSEMNPQQDTSFPQRRFVRLSRPPRCKW